MSSSALSQPDLVIRNGQIADGRGSDLFTGDVAIKDGIITAVGPVQERGREEIDAAGALVTPGFVDIHTHYDGQAVWSERFSPSSIHGVTTVVLGNCGVGFAPCKPGDHDLLVSVMEGVEDIPEIVMTAGLDWSWETFPQYMDSIEKRPHDIDFGVYLPHSPLRVYVMGERGANREAATPDDLAQMQAIMREALKVGALGFATSDVFAHRTGKGDFIPSYHSGEKEYVAIAQAMKEANSGVFQMVVEQRQEADVFVSMMERVSRSCGRPVTFSFTQMMDVDPLRYREVLTAVNKVNQSGDAHITPQVFPRPIGMIMGHDLSVNPFSFCPSYAAIRDMSPAERLQTLRNPEVRQRLLTEQPGDPTYPLLVIARDFKRLYPFRSPADYEPPKDGSILAIAERTGKDPLEIAYDLLLENDGNGLILGAITNYARGTLDDVYEMMTNGNTVLGLGDGGAHYGMICDASFTTFMLTHWTRDRKGDKITLPKAIRALTSEPAAVVGMHDRGILAPGYKANVNVIDYDNLRLEMPTVRYDLPGGGRRLYQGAKGYLATIVNGEIIVRNDQLTDKLPGKLVRGTQRRPSAA